MLFADYSAEASCTTGRANLITGELPISESEMLEWTGARAGARLGMLMLQDDAWQTAIEYPPMQVPASFRLEAVNREVDEKIRAH